VTATWLGAAARPATAALERAWTGGGGALTALSKEERGRDGVVGVTLVGAADQGLNYLQHCPLDTSQPQTPLHMATVVSPAALKAKIPRKPRQCALPRTLSPPCTIRCRLSCQRVARREERDRGRRELDGAAKEVELDGDGAGEDTGHLRQPRRGHARMPMAGTRRQPVMRTSM
jgi:hypothetical protein